jgi:hypothetical protein
MIREYNSDFEYKDKRNYVHSSTLVSDFSELILLNYYSIDKWDNPVIDAKFTEVIQSNGIFRLVEGDGSLGKKNPISAKIVFYDKNIKISAVFIENKSQMISRRIATNYGVSDVVLNEDFSGTCSVECNSLDETVENVIEANKRIHLLTLAGKGDQQKVVNVYMKKFPVTLPEEKTKNRVLLKIKNTGVRYQNKSVTTLNSFSFQDSETECFEIAYKVTGLSF